jgi:hypothetical protein
MDAVFAPHKTDAVLIVDPDAMLSLAIPYQGFEAVSWRRAQIIQRRGGIDHIQLSTCNRCDARPAAVLPLKKKRGGIVVFEALDHT